MFHDIRDIHKDSKHNFVIKIIFMKLYLRKKILVIVRNNK